MIANNNNNLKKSTNIKIILLFAAISLATLLLILWLVDFSNLNMPEFISGTQVRLYGVLIFIAFIIIFIFLQKTLLRYNPQTSIFDLIIYSAAVSFISLFLYQLIRQLIVLRGQYDYNLLTVLLSSAVPAFVFTLVALSIAQALKKVKGIWVYVPTLIIVALYYLAKPYLHLFEW